LSSTPKGAYSSLKIPSWARFQFGQGPRLGRAYGECRIVGIRACIATVMFAGFLLVAAQAESLNGVTFPDTYKVGGQTLVLNGMGVRTLTAFQIEIYVAALYLANPSSDPGAIEASSTPKALILYYLHDGSKEQVEKQFRAGEQTNCGAGGCPPSDGTDFEKLVAAAPAVRAGDTTTYIFTRKGFQVFANGQYLIGFDNPDLGNRLLDGFIGAHPPSTSLKIALLGGR